jgi:hypothetical protein
MLSAELQNSYDFMTGQVVVSGAIPWPIKEMILTSNRSRYLKYLKVAGETKLIDLFTELSGKELIDELARLYGYRDYQLNLGESSV